LENGSLWHKQLTANLLWHPWNNRRAICRYHYSTGFSL